MKKYVFTFLSFWVLTSCTQDNEHSPDFLVDSSWEKTEIVTPHLGTSLSEDEIGYQETYLFYRAGTFKKFNSKTGIEFWGEYRLAEPSELQSKEIRSVYILQYDWFDLIMNASQFEDVTDEFCSSCPSLGSFVFGWGTTERLFLYHDGRLVNPGPCCFNDLPVYFYRQLD